MTLIKNFIPSGIADFDSWQINFVTQANLLKGGWDWSATVDTEWALLTTTAGMKKLRWDAIHTIIATNNFKPSDEVEMLASRKDYEFGIRETPTDTSLRIFITRYIRNNPLVSVEQKRTMGLTVPDETPTATSDINAKISGIVLSGSMKKVEHLIHTVAVVVPGQKSVAMGEGVDAIEIFIAITVGTQTTQPDLSTFVLDGEVKRGLYTHTFTANQVGMRAWYYVRKRIKGKTKTWGPPSLVWSEMII